MDRQELRQIADSLGVESSPFTPAPNLIRAIQRRLGQRTCFGRDERYWCTERGCDWREECLRPIAVWMR